MLNMKFYNCSCFTKSNFYIKSLGQHVQFINREQFMREYKSSLDDLKSDEEKELVLQEVAKELDRRKALESESIFRKEKIKTLYKPLHPEIFHLKEDLFDSKFIKLVQECKATSDANSIPNYITTLSQEKRIYGFPVFTMNFCKKIIEEIEHFETTNLPKGQPNSMIKHGVILDELGFTETFLDPFRNNYIYTVAKKLFPEWCKDALDSHYAFTTSYKVDKQKNVDIHFDNSEVTLNVCLGKQFLEGELFFGEMKDSVPPLSSSFSSPYTVLPHKIGFGMLHRGQQVHGTLPITEGEGINMIIWFRSSSVRNKLCPMCGQKPDLIPASGYGSGFTISDKEENTNK